MTFHRHAFPITIWNNLNMPVPRHYFTMEKILEIGRIQNLWRLIFENFLMKRPIRHTLINCSYPTTSSLLKSLISPWLRNSHAMFDCSSIPSNFFLEWAHESDSFLTDYTFPKNYAVVTLVKRITTSWFDCSCCFNLKGMQEVQAVSSTDANGDVVFWNSGWTYYSDTLCYFGSKVGFETLSLC